MLGGFLYMPARSCDMWGGVDRNLERKTQGTDKIYA